ncbi:MAG: GTPase Era [Alphaproteobacteria bacterium]|nr:GTPase Era [Alphaproteobacteria bacterium]
MTKKANKPATKPKAAAKPKKTHAGFVALIGAPNAGKSTLLNQLIGQKISIVSPKAQTTRIRTLGILSEGDTQISFIDTPGIFAPKRRLDRAMVQAAWNSIDDADAAVLLIDASKRLDEKTESILDELKARKQPLILALNKVDAIDPARLLPLAAKLNDTGIFSDIFMISALKGDGVEDLKKHLQKKMPESPWFFDADQISDLPAQILAAEMTREQLYRQLQQELPYGAAVLPESLEEKRDGSAVIRQTIVVARDNHRAIVLGKGGARIKSIGESARADLARLFDRKIHLFLNVKTDEKWQDRPDFYRAFGLDFGKK